VAGVSGLVTAGLASGAHAATTRSTAPAARGPAWHTILSLPNGKTTGNAVDTVVATGKTSGWAFLVSSTVAHERTGSNASNTAANRSVVF
jgi:hypothetical protein